MNSTFKVVFNKARGALMVVNEVTSSVQAKGTKTVVAAAVATMIAGVAGSTMAAEWKDAPEGLKAETDTVITDANWTAIKDKNAFELTASNKEDEAKKPWASVANLKTRKTSLGRSSKARNVEKPLETGAFRLHQVSVYCIIYTLTLEQNSWQPPRNTLLKSARFPSSIKRRE